MNTHFSLNDPHLLEFDEALEFTPPSSPTPYPQNRRPRASSLPPSSSPGPIATSPLVGTREERRLKAIQKAVKKRERNRLAQAQSQEEPLDLHAQYEAALNDLDARGITLGGLAEFVFNPENEQKSVQWEGFFQSRGRATRILNWWASSFNSKTGQKEVQDWAVEFIARTARKEAETVTKEGVLRRQIFDEHSVIGFGFGELYNSLKTTYATVTVKVLDAIAQSSRQIRRGISAAREMQKQVVIVSAFSNCLSLHSQRNNLLKRLFGLFLYASGAQRQVLTVLNHLGVAESYSNLTAKATAFRKTPGTLQQLSQTLRERARTLAKTGIFGEVYDNINFADKVGEQVIGRTNTVESGTCATIWPLHNASPDDMKLEDFIAAFDRAPPLTFSDINHSSEEAALFKRCLTHCILRIIVTHGGEGFTRFRKRLQDTLPATPDAIQTHKTQLHPLPTWKIDESTIVGNAEVDEAVVAELQLRNQPSTWMKQVRVIAGDQLSIARLRTLARLRAGHVGGYGGFGWGAWLPGLFHGKMADMHGIFVTHWGKPNAGTRNPGSLNFHNTLLRHLPISLTSLPTFRTCRDLVFVSLYARVLHCLLLVSGCKSLEDYCNQVQKWETLEQHAQQILQDYANPGRVSTLRAERLKDAGGDMVFENGVLFLRDALISREFTDAVKAGDSGRILLVVKIWALSFRGNGRSKYAHEMLILIHNICKVWPKEIAKIIMSNWVLNPSGNPNSFVEVDLVQEHMNYWIKLFYKAHGPNSTWEWLEMISPCVHALRNLANTMKKVLGTDIGTRHSPVDLTTDIKTLMRSLAEHDVYSVTKGRKLDDDDKPAVDVVTEGIRSLIEGPALDEYNTAFSKLQERRRMRPVIDDNERLNNAPPSSQDSTSEQPETTVPAIEGGAHHVQDDEMASGELEPDGNESYDPDDPDPISVQDGEQDTLKLLTIDDIAFEMDIVEQEDEIDDDGDEEGFDVTLQEVLES